MLHYEDAPYKSTAMRYRVFWLPPLQPTVQGGLRDCIDSPGSVVLSTHDCRGRLCVDMHCTRLYISDILNLRPS